MDEEECSTSQTKGAVNQTTQVILRPSHLETIRSGYQGRSTLSSSLVFPGVIIVDGASKSRCRQEQSLLTVALKSCNDECCRMFNHFECQRVTRTV